MAFKINVSHKGKTFKVETSNENLVGYSIGDNIPGKEISNDLEGYELEITGTSDKAGFMGRKEIDGSNLKKILLGYGSGMHKKPKGLKKVNKTPKGLRLRKTVRGKEISLWGLLSMFVFGSMFYIGTLVLLLRLKRTWDLR